MYPWLLFISLCIHAFRRFSGKPSPRFSLVLPFIIYHSDYFNYILLIHLHKKAIFGFMLTFALMTQLGR
jgi:hypothetical protein